MVQVSVSLGQGTPEMSMQGSFAVLVHCMYVFDMHTWQAATKHPYQVEPHIDEARKFIWRCLRNLIRNSSNQATSMEQFAWAVGSAVV